MKIAPIRSKAQYKAALKTLSAFFDRQPDPNTQEGQDFEVLAILVEAYENKHHQIDPPDPIEAIKYRMEVEGLGIKDLVPMIGRPNRVHEILNRRRPLTLAMMTRIRNTLKISGDVLLNQAAVKAARAPANRGSAKKNAQAKKSRSRDTASA
jgi:HTH-type transcriptional regulator/antitoxin HigA